MTTIADLQSVLPKLSANDAKFAGDLIAQSARRGLSEKQLYWVDKLYHRASDVAPVTKPTINVGDMSGVIALFDRAREHLKFPAIVLKAESDTIRLNVAGVQAKQPGTVNVASHEKFTTHPVYGKKRVWYGRIARDGTYQPSNTADASIAALLIRFAAEPAKVATEYGRLTGRCCFCNLPLTDERSTAVGYGKTCAKNWGMPWGEAHTTFEAA